MNNPLSHKKHLIKQMFSDQIYNLLISVDNSEEFILLFSKIGTNKRNLTRNEIKKISDQTGELISEEFFKKPFKKQNFSDPETRKKIVLKHLKTVLENKEDKTNVSKQ